MTLTFELGRDFCG